MSFSNDFVWGSAAASYQVEGGANADGKGESVWDMFCRKPGAIWSGQTGAEACDHYHRYREDVAIMKEIGLKAYRLSLSWSRVIPQGTGSVNPKGLDFYNRLVDELLAANVTPWITLFHWDYPLALYRRGGWLNRDSVEWFADYTRVVVDALSDRVRHWFTLNEPQCFIGLGHYEGKHAPGDRLDYREVLLAAHHCLMSHGRAVQVIREFSKQPAQVGYAPVGVGYMPATDSPADIAAAREMAYAVRTRDYWSNAWWIDPVCLGKYPEQGLEANAADLPDFDPADLKVIHQPLDFLACNMYAGQYVRAGAGGKPEVVPMGVEVPTTANRWYITPEVLRWMPQFLHERYKLPIVISENGMSGIDFVSLDGKVHDPQRIDLLHRYLLQLRSAVDAGVPVKGYFVWSIMDNFEWAEGFKERFGLVHVDYATQKRTMKDSAYWYRDVIAANGANL
jgi:beta-glucosidase